MKRILIILVLAAIWCGAQPQTPSLEEKVVALENQISTLQQSVAVMQKQVDEVTRQNLSLKYALDLRTPITEAITESGINYRLISAVGDSINHIVMLTFSVVNTKPAATYCEMSGATFIDDKGNQYADKDFKSTRLGTEFVVNGCYVIPQTPIMMTIVFPGVSTDAEYIKTFNVKSDFHKGSFHLHDIPIQWE